MPKLMTKPGGINTYFDPVFGEVELHSSTCRHCQHVTDFPSRRVMMDYVDVCFKCAALVCREPECQQKGCIPFEKQADEAENAFYLRQRIYIQGWRCY